MKNKMSRIFVIVYTACIISCILLSVCLVSYVAARYFTQATGSDSARVAGFEFDVLDDSKQEISLNIRSLTKPGDSFSYEFSVSGGKSEVDQVYTVSIETTGNLPLTYTLKRDAMAVLTTNRTATWQDDTNYFNASNPETHSYTLTISWPSTADASYADEIDYIKLIVHSEQVD